MSVYFLYGDEDYNIELAINEKKKSLDKNFSAMNFKTYDNPKFTDLIAILRTTPMMFGKMLVVINCNEYFSKTFEDKELKEIEEAIKLVPEMLDIIFVATLPRGEGKKLDSRRKIYKILAKTYMEEYPSFRSYEVEKISNWVNTEAKKQDIVLDKEACLSLIEHIGTNLREFVKELEKLKLLAYPEKTVTKDMIKEICITNEEIFAFTDYIIEGKLDLALLEFRKLLDKKHEMEILATLQTMIRRAVLVKLYSTKMSNFEVARQVGMQEFLVQKTIQKMKNHSLKDLIKLKQNLLNVEYRIKSGQCLDAVGEIENAIVR